MHNDTKYIEQVTFQQIKSVTQASLSHELESFERQFSGCVEVIA